MIPCKGHTLRLREKSVLRRIYETCKYKRVKFASTPYSQTPSGKEAEGV